MRETLKIKGKIGIYGRSLGGIPASYLSNRVSMAIVDRSFGNLAETANWKFRSKYANFLLKYGSCGWQAQNDFNFIQKHQSEEEFINDPERKEQEGCYKVIT